MKIDTEKYLPFTEAVERSGRSKSVFMEYVAKGFIEALHPYRRGSFYKISDIDKIKKVKKDAKKSD